MPIRRKSGPRAAFDIHADARDSGATGPGDRLPHVRVLMYSHDTFGLGHLRRCRAIAHALVERFKGVQVLIVSGSSIAGAFEFRTRVDFLKVPSIIKLINGEYTPLSQHTDLHETLALRRSLILSTAESFRPDIFIVDKEPLGPARRTRADAELPEGARHHAGARAARRHGFARTLLAAEWARHDVHAPRWTRSTMPSGSMDPRISTIRWTASTSRPRCAGG